MRSRLVICIAAVLCASALCASRTEALVIDEFLDNGSALSIEVNKLETVKVNSSSAVGGVRILNAILTAGNPGVEIRTLGGNLMQSQASEASGNGQVFWNKGLTKNDTSFYGGLGGLDITQDGGTKLILQKVHFDVPAQFIRVEILLYDASDPVTGSIYSSYTFFLSTITSDQNVEIPFTSFQAGPLGPANFKNIGAIALNLYGSQSPDADLNIASVRTDGKCVNDVPDNNMKVIDDCGICISQPGYNTSRDDCGTCFGENKEKDSCGLCPKDSGYKTSMDDCGDCFGNNHAIDDCGICDGNNKSKDLCGICGGDSSSCKDCLGIPDGTAKYDACGVCAGDGTSCTDCAGTPYGAAALDRCGVCAGDGTSCVKCTDTDLSDLLMKLIAKSTDQRKNAFFYILRVIEADPGFAKSSKAKVLKLYANLLELVKGLPSQVKECEDNPFCTKKTGHMSIVNQYSSTAKKLWLLSQNILTHQIKLGPGKCTGSASECMKRVAARQRNTASLKTYNRRLYLQNIALIRKIPKVISVCEE